MYVLLNSFQQFSHIAVVWILINFLAFDNGHNFEDATFSKIKMTVDNILKKFSYSNKSRRCDFSKKLKCTVIKVTEDFIYKCGSIQIGVIALLPRSMNGW